MHQVVKVAVSVEFHDSPVVPHQVKVPVAGRPLVVVLLEFIVKERQVPHHASKAPSRGSLGEHIVHVLYKVSVVGSLPAEEQGQEPPDHALSLGLGVPLSQY